MITVVIPKQKNKIPAEEICRILEKFGGACLITKNSVQDFFAVSPSFLLFLTDTVCAVPEKNTVLLLADTDTDIKISDSCRFTCVITEGMPKEAYNGKTVTVGMGRQNDIGISSTESGHMHIAVQNAVRTLTGKEILPCEFSVLGSTQAPYSAVLYAFTLLLLTEKADTEALTVRL